METCRAPSCENEFLPLRRNCRFLPASPNQTKIQVETRKEILADRLIAFPAAPESCPRWRSHCDLNWLRARQVGMARNRLQMVENRTIDDFDGLLESAIGQVPEPVEHRALADQMSRSLDRRSVDTTAGVMAWREALARDLHGRFSDCAWNWRRDKAQTQISGH